MKCPRCFDDNVSAVGDTHYICNNPNCIDDNGERVQFQVIYDTEIKFPYNQIFIESGLHQFYRKPYLKIKPVGETHTHR